jgi:hypothetical protein
MQVTRETLMMVSLVLLLVMTVQFSRINSSLRETKIMVEHLSLMLNDMSDKE